MSVSLLSCLVPYPRLDSSSMLSGEDTVICLFFSVAFIGWVGVGFVGSFVVFGCVKYVTLSVYDI